MPVTRCFQSQPKSVSGRTPTNRTSPAQMQRVHQEIVAMTAEKFADCRRVVKPLAEKHVELQRSNVMSDYGTMYADDALPTKNLKDKKGEFYSNAPPPPLLKFLLHLNFLSSSFLHLSAGSAYS